MDAGTSKGGKQWAKGGVNTTVPAANLLNTGRATIKADGPYLSFITVTVAGKDGLPVSRAKHRLRFEISGPAEIVATDNGDATNHESFQATERNA